MKQTLLAVFSLLLCANATVMDKKGQTVIPPNACLAVYPGGQQCVTRDGGLTHNCFSYLESANVPMKEIKTYYLKKDLEKLEGRGVKVVVTTNGVDQTRGSACPATEK